MRTTLDLDDRLFETLMARYPGATKTEAVERAIREHLADDAARRLRELRGRVEITDLSDELRRDRRVSVLPDTSIWIDYFRGTEPVAGELGRLITRNTPSICGPILAELVAGTPADSREDVWLALAGLPFVDLDRDAWTLAGEVAHRLRATGETVPLLDLLIAVAAVRADAALWTKGSDLQRVAQALPELRLHRRVR